MGPTPDGYKHPLRGAAAQGLAPQGKSPCQALASASGPDAVNCLSVGAANMDDAVSRRAATPGGAACRGAAKSSGDANRCAAQL